MFTVVLRWKWLERQKKEKKEREVAREAKKKEKKEREVQLGRKTREN
jgi:hypothetical protein